MFNCPSIFLKPSYRLKSPCRNAFLPSLTNLSDVAVDQDNSPSKDTNEDENSTDDEDEGDHLGKDENPEENADFSEDEDPNEFPEESRDYSDLYEGDAGQDPSFAKKSLLCLFDCALTLSQSRSFLFPLVGGYFVQ